ncbi:MAG: FliH/SctL family protein [Terracidiphilus sp.]|nr:FliH/SctL family protein [Terracidiphilus sp.]
MAQQVTAPPRIELFQYPATPEDASAPDWHGWMDTSEPGMPEEQPHEPVQTVKETEVRAEFEKRLAEETRKAFEAGRERGKQEGRQAEHETQAASLKAAEQVRVRQGAELIERFAQERDSYLQKVEQEVVKLALAVAARILRREAQMDPLLLTGAVRVAMGQLSGSTEVKLRVPAADLALWKDAIALLPNLALKPSVSAGEGMRLGDCVIETSMGSVDLGIRSQLGEIERGFFDRATAAASSSSAQTGSATDQSSEAHA